MSLYYIFNNFYLTKLYKGSSFFLFKMHFFTVIMYLIVNFMLIMISNDQTDPYLRFGFFALALLTMLFASAYVVIIGIACWKGSVSGKDAITAIATYIHSLNSLLWRQHQARISLEP